MKRLNLAAGVFAALLAVTASGGALGGAGGHRGYQSGHYSGHYSGHRHWHSSVFIGVPLGWGWYYPPAPYYYPPGAYYYPPGPYYYPPVAAAPASPPVYVERGDTSSAPAPLWFYCEAAKAYFPYVKECPAGWVTVEPTPPR